MDTISAEEGSPCSFYNRSPPEYEAFFPSDIRRRYFHLLAMIWGRCNPLYCDSNSILGVLVFSYVITKSVPTVRTYTIRSSRGTVHVTRSCWHFISSKMVKLPLWTPWRSTWEWRWRELHLFLEVSGAASSHRSLYRMRKARGTHCVGRCGGGKNDLSFLGIEPWPPVRPARSLVTMPITLFRSLLLIVQAPRLSLVTYRYAPHNDVLVNNGPRRWSHKIII